MKQASKYIASQYLLPINETFSGDCHKHGEWMFIFNKCPLCIKDKMERETKESIIALQEENKRASLKNTLKNAAIPSLFDSNKHSFNYFRLDSKINPNGQQNALKACKAYADNFKNELSIGRNGILFGNVGNGKTLLAICILKTIIANGFTGIYRTLPDLFDEVRRSQYDNNCEINEFMILEELYSLDLLVIDEITGVTKQTEAVENLVFKVINKRCLDCKPTVVITNEVVNPEERIMSRLLQSNFLVCFDWEDYRLKK